MKKGREWKFRRNRKSFLEDDKEENLADLTHDEFENKSGGKRKFTWLKNVWTILIWMKIKKIN